jgi:nitrogen regulatory protein PII-like uncharacterized protein
MQTYLVDYELRFYKIDVSINVKFQANLSARVIESSAFLFSNYFEQTEIVRTKGLTFFNEFNTCVNYVKSNFEHRQNDDNVKRLFSFFLKDEFMSQVPQFRNVIKFLKVYYKPIERPNVRDIVATCTECTEDNLHCFQCKKAYLSKSISVFDSGIQHGWDIFLRPMFGLPLFLSILLRTDFSTNFDESGVFNADDLITNTFAQFFYNLLCDKASSNYVDRNACRPLIADCQKVTANMSDRDLEMLLCLLRDNNNCESKIFAPFKQFVLKFMAFVKDKKINKKINKIASVIFTGFFLRQYLDSAPKKTKSAAELELRNVCRFIMHNYNDEQMERFVQKIYSIKEKLMKKLLQDFIVTERYIRHLIIEHRLEEEFSVLLDENVQSDNNSGR